MRRNAPAPYQVLARKWRPASFGEVVGQDAVVRSLSGAVRSGRVGHAYLLAGTRGIGKTTVARIFARALRCLAPTDGGEACGSCPPCADAGGFDVIEIDGASNNTVDEVRELIARVQYLPATGKRKAYIIDEVHMLSRSAFNALLKTLEEPPSHAVFIFATTAPEKLPETVLSRCQRFDLRDAPLEVLEARVREIAGKEGIVFGGDGVVTELCRAGGGSVRDTLSALELALSYAGDGPVTEEALRDVLGLAGRSAARRLARAVLGGDADGAAGLYREMAAGGVSEERAAHALLDALFEAVEGGAGDAAAPDPSEPLSEAELLWVYEEAARDFRWALASLDPFRSLEVVLRKLARRRDLLRPEPAATTAATAAAAAPAPRDPPAAADPGDAADGGAGRSWDGFLGFVGERSRIMRTNLEKGNVLAEPSAGPPGTGLGVDVVFPASAHVFCEYLRDHAKEVASFLARYYGVDEGAVSLSLRVIGDGEAKERGFRPKDRILAEERERELDRKRERVASDPMVRKAQEIFGAKVDRIDVR